MPNINQDMAEMIFYINETKWTIKLVSTDEIIKLNDRNEGTLGLTIYREQIVYIDKEQVNMIKTLKHELSHVWLYEYGHSYKKNGICEEECCEIIASSNNFINSVTEAFISENKVKND